MQTENSMVAKVKTEKELAEAIEREEETIEIEGDLGKKTFKIRATGKLAWLVAAGAIGVALVGVSRNPISRNLSPQYRGLMAIPAGGAVAVIGMGATYTAIAIAVAAGGIGVLAKLRAYRQVSYADNRLILQRARPVS